MYIRKKIASILILLIFVSGCSNSSNEKSETTPANDSIVISQDFVDDSTGITKAVATIKFTDDEVTEVTHVDTYSSEEYATTMYEELLCDTDNDERYNFIQNGCIITYNDVYLDDFSGYSYDELLAFYEEDGVWTIIE